jgi:hypothetical protein
VENYLPKDYHETFGRKYDVGNLQAALRAQLNSNMNNNEENSWENFIVCLSFYYFIFILIK